MKKALLAALAALAALPAAAAGGAKARPYALDLTAATYGGAFDGLGVREDSGSMAIVEVAGTPEVTGRQWRLEVPFRVAHRETFGAELSETSGAIDVEPWYQATERVRLGLEAGALGASRPRWPDLYQRDGATGALAPTDRYGYLAWRAGAQLYARPGRRQHLRARYRHARYDYVEDSEFTELDVTHLTPRDRSEEHLDVSWRYVERSWDVALRMDYTRRRYDTLVARNRRSGATPEDALGNELNPTQKLNLYAPSAELGVELGGRVKLDLRYGIDLQDDPFQGYYSYTGHHPGVGATLALGERATVKAAFEGWYRTYGPDGSTRLDGGTRRKDARTDLSGRLEYRVAARVVLVGEARHTTRSTNYSDLVQLTPSPSTGRTYDIDYDYTNFVGLAGLEYRL